MVLHFIHGVILAIGVRDKCCEVMTFSLKRCLLSAYAVYRSFVPSSRIKPITEPRRKAAEAKRTIIVLQGYHHALYGLRRSGSLLRRISRDATPDR
jgi:hypothetical protein